MASLFENIKCRTCIQKSRGLAIDGINGARPGSTIFRNSSSRSNKTKLIKIMTAKAKLMKDYRYLKAWKQGSQVRILQKNLMS